MTVTTATVAPAETRVPLWVICHRVLSGERPAGRTVAGAAMGFGGMVVLVTVNGLGGAFPIWTMAVLLVAGLSWAFGSRYQPRIQLPRDPFVVAVYERSSALGR